MPRARTAPKQARGAAAEAQACRFLQQQGLQLAARNFRCRRGEIDLVMQDNQEWVFVEVRYRRQQCYGRADYGGAAASVNQAKQQRLVAAARLFLAKAAGDWPARFDVVAISGDNNLEWIKNAFTVDSGS